MKSLVGRSAALALAGLLLLLPAAVLAQTSGGVLAGRIVDASGAPAPGASVTAVSPATGFSRAVVTESDGTFRFPNLPVGTYDVTVKLTGFKTLEKKGVVLNVATTRSLDFTIEVATIEESVSVVAEAPVVQTEAAIGTVVSKKELESLPLNGRQFANLAVLAPGTTLAYNSDPTKPGQLTVALNGGIGRNVNFVVDGGDNTDDTIGGALQNFSIENVEEFKIQTQQYKAEYGRSSGGQLTVVTKTGSNEFHGSAFGYFRDKSLNAITESELQGSGEKSPYSRKQFGGSVGGPIVKDKAHFFASYERTQRDTEYTVDTGGLMPGDDGKSVALPFRDDLIGAKVTVNPSAKQFLQVRFGYQKNTDKYGASPLATPDSLGTLTNKYYSVLVGHTLQVGEGMLNEIVFQYTKFDNDISADSKNPTIYYPSGAHSGQNINTPQTTHQVKYQFKDDFSFSKTIGGHRHDFKLGANFIHEPTLGGDFSTGVDAPLFAMLEDRVGSPVREITQFGGSFADSTPVDQFSVYVQDDWQASSRLTINLGVRYDVWTGFDLNQTTNPIWKTLSSQTRFNESYLQDFQGGKGGVLSNDKNNVGPRVGFSYDVNGRGKTFIRGGYGFYYDFPYTNATILFPAAAVQSNYGVVYSNADSSGVRNSNGTFFQPGQALPANQLPAADIPPPNEVASPTLATPMARQGSLGFSTEVAKGFAIAVEGVTIAYRDIPFRFRANPRTGAGQSRRFSDFGNFRLWYGKGFADYKGVNLSLRARVSDKLTLQGFYTLSKADGNVLAGADEFRLSDVGFQPDLRNARDVSVNPLDPLCGACTGPLNTDARHRFTLGGTYDLPWQITLSAMFRFRSATPINIYAGKDLNGDGFVMDLPPGVTNVNSGRSESFKQLDIRASKRIKFSDKVSLELLAEAFNVFNATNPAGFVGNQAAGNYLQPTTYAGDPLQGEQRLAQLGARFRF